MPQTHSFDGERTENTLQDLPHIGQDEPLGEVLRKLSIYFVDAIEAPHTYEQLRTASVGHILKPIIKSLSDTCHHPDIVSALLILKHEFTSAEKQDGHAIHETRGHACEIVAWRFLMHLSPEELLDYLLHELPPVSFDPEDHDEDEIGEDDAERAALLSGRMDVNTPSRSRKSSDNPKSSFVGHNALEIAAMADAKKFISQRTVQKTVDDIWNGDIMFWESLSVHSRKKAKFYNKARADPYTRLRVPKYQKTFEALFFASFLGLYYAVLVERNPERIKFVEALLYIWIPAFAYDEFSKLRDVGTSFYAADFWSLWDLGIITVGFAYMITRIVGVTKGHQGFNDVSFDILSLEALFLLPRVCSLVSIVPYFGTLIPCLKEMTKDFMKFLGIVIIFFCGFLTTFTMLARGDFTPGQVLWIMLNCLLGSTSTGFDAAPQISTVLGPILMPIFIMLTDILLLTILIAILSQVFTEVMDHAREEYFFEYSVFVLEASASRRLTYFFPPLNLLPLVFRPLRLCVSSEQMRPAHIVLLKITHAPYVAGIWVYEELYALSSKWQSSKKPQQHMHYAKRDIHTHPPASKPTPRRKSVASVPKTPGSAKRPHAPADLDLADALKAINERLATMEGKIDQLSK